VLSTVEALDAANQRAEVEQQAAEAANKESQLKQQIEQSRANLDVFTRSWRQRLLDDLLKAQRERDPLQEQLSKSERRKALVRLTAPFDAVVLDINRRSVGSVAREADPIVTLVPQGVPLEAELQIASEDIGFVRVGDPVKLKIDAFPFQKHGVVTGRLTVVGEDSFTAGTSSGQPQQRASTRAYYTGRVTELAADLKKVPKDTRLTPGMTLAAEIRVSERSVISYFMYPLIKAFDESIREP
jgi:HlyD family secretion protein